MIDILHRSEDAALDRIGLLHSHFAIRIVILIEPQFESAVQCAGNGCQIIPLTYREAPAVRGREGNEDAAEGYFFHLGETFFETDLDRSGNNFTFKTLEYDFPDAFFRQTEPDSSSYIVELQAPGR